MVQVVQRSAISQRVAGGSDRPGGRCGRGLRGPAAVAGRGATRDRRDPVAPPRADLAADVRSPIGNLRAIAITHPIGGKSRSLAITTSHLALVAFRRWPASCR